MVGIELDVSHHCIETAIRRRYNRTLSAYFNAGADNRPALEARLELLTAALESFDFSFLRRTYPELAGGGAHDVCLEADPQHHPRIRLNGVRL